MENQDQLLQKAINRSAKIKIVSDLEKRYSVLDKSGLEKAKEFLKMQKEQLVKNKESFEEAKNMLVETNRRIEEERRNFEVVSL